MKPLALWERFEWAVGTCFRCDRTDVEVAPIGTIHARGIDVEVQACRACVFHLEQLHWCLVMRQHSTEGPPPGSVRAPGTGAGPTAGMPRAGPVTPTASGRRALLPGGRCGGRGSDTGPWGDIGGHSGHRETERPFGAGNLGRDVLMARHHP